MPDEPRVQELLDELLDREATPEEVCGACEELLPVVRKRWRQICLMRAELDALLPVWPHGNLPTMPPEELSLPQVPGYAVEAELGRGGMGVVFRARQLRLHRLVALKMTLAGCYAGPKERERFRREAEAVAALRHANIVQIYDVSDWAGQSYFTMELIEGGSLAGRLAGVPQPARQAAALLATLAEAMHAAHQGGIVHRDLKPANILFTPDGTPKITDFGLARRLEGGAGLTLSGVPLGTPNYMAPEQARGQSRTVGPAVDVYALGAILYELLTGRPPFRAETPAETLRQVIDQEPVPPARLNAKVPRDLETVCLKCLQKEPHRRYASAAALADDLGRFLRGEPVVARPVGGLERAAKWARRNPTVTVLSAVAVVALVVGSVVSALFGVEARRKAGALERQTIQLQDQTRAARMNAQRAEESGKEVTRAMLAGLLIPIDNNPRGPYLVEDSLSLDAAEAEALRQLGGTSAPVRFQFLEMTLRDPEKAWRVGHRADWVVQAVVGCDRSVRADVGRLVVRRIQEPGAPQEVRLACARLGVALNLADRAWAECSANALLGALRDPLIERQDYPPLAEALAAVSECLPPDQAGYYAVQATDVLLTRLQAPMGRLLFNELSQAVVAMSPRLDAAAAARAAKDLAALIRRPGYHPFYWQSICRALAAVCRQSPPSDSASELSETVDFIIASRGATTNKVDWVLQAKAMSALCERLDAAGVARVCEAILGMVDDGETNEYVAAALAEAAEHLDAEASRQAAEQLIRVLRISKGVSPSTELLESSLALTCRHLDAAGTARVSDAIVAAVRDPQTSIHGHTLFAHACVVLCDQLDPATAAYLEDALVDVLVADLSAPNSVPVRQLLGQALASVCRRPGARGAARAAEPLVAALRDPKTPLDSLKPLAEALASVDARLAPTEAALHANQAVAVLESLWVTKTAPGERAAVAGALAAVWTLLGPDDAVARARRTADELEDAIRGADVATEESYKPAEALAAVYGRLGSTERIRRTNAVADVVIAALRRPRIKDDTVQVLTDGLIALCRNLDRPGAVRMANALLTVLGKPDIRRHGFEFRGKTFKSVAAQLEEPDLKRLLEHPLVAGRVQRDILDVLGEAKHRHFRNTWDYLDWAETHRN